MRVVISLLVFVTITSISCKKEKVNDYIGPPTNNNNNNNTPQMGITYPDTAIYDNSSMTYGRNILSMPDSSVLLETTNYTIAASLETDAHLRLVFTNYSSHDSTFWYYINPQGFTVTNLDSVTTEIVSNQSGNIYMPIN